MFRQLFSVFFLFFLVCCQLCEQRQNVNGAQTPGEGTEYKFFEFLKPENQIKIEPKSLGVKDQVTDFTVKNIESVYFVATENVMVALAQLNYTKTDPEGNEFTSSLANVVKTDEGSLTEEEIAKNNEWKELAAKKFQKPKSDTSIKSFAVVVKGKTIYHITVSNDTLKDGGLSGSFPEWHARLVKGTVPDSSSGAANTIRWEDAKYSESYKDNEVPKKPNKNPGKIPPSDAFAFVTEEENIYFFMKGKEATGSGGENKNIVSVFLLDKDGKELKLLPVENIENCYSSFFQWKGEIIMMPTKDSNCDGKTLMVFDASQNKFAENKSSIARLSNFLKDKSSFSTAIIEEKEVLFFTEQKTQDDKNVYLWMSDGTRVGYVGIIDSNGEHMFYKLVLYSKEKLFALRQKYKLGDNNNKKEVVEVSFAHLKEQFKNVTKNFNVWKKGNESVLKLCERAENPDSLCTTPPPTDGLVGFLHNTINESTDKIIWKDEFVYSDATVEEGNPVPNGLTFNGVGAGATWPVNGENQKYYFSNHGFTLVATVQIDSDANKNSVLGIGFGGSKKSIGVWCDKGKWSVSDGTTAKTAEKIVTEKLCVKEGIYHVALILDKNKFNLYIGKRKEEILPDSVINVQESLSITHFYFGAEKNAKTSPATDESHVTVTNVLLYNRPFEENEIKNLNEYIKPVEVTTRPKEKTGIQGDEVPPTLPTDSHEKEEKTEAPSPSRTEDGGVGGGVRVFSLLLAVLCVSAPLLHL